VLLENSIGMVQVGKRKKVFVTNNSYLHPAGSKKGRGCLIEHNGFPNNPASGKRDRSGSASSAEREPEWQRKRGKKRGGGMGKNGSPAEGVPNKRDPEGENDGWKKKGAEDSMKKHFMEASRCRIRQYLHGKNDAKRIRFKKDGRRDGRASNDLK